ncbi:hypothetical protein Glove_365g227 [Diversispora epigaea]|uniref:BZIP domain-containing protein n=1 Tax=Diversispora epigaea TaxID=1348612 RepID=A0A397HAR7_9GLOM|nr:hypothetical protein Glove_365g227 [Diversispora epigaea]
MENTHFSLNELLSLSPNQTFCNESFSFMNELTIQDVESELGNQSKKRNREECEGGEEGEGSRKRSHREDEEELLSLSPNQTFCNESFSFMNELTIQDVESELGNQSKKRNREECEGGEEGEGSRKRSHREDEEGEKERIKREKKRESDRKSALRYRKKKKSEAEKLEQKVNELEEKNKFLKNEVNQLSKEFLELRDFLLIDFICNHL